MGYVTIIGLRCVKINSVNLIIDKINGYIKQNNGNKYLRLIATDEIKDIVKKLKKSKKGKKKVKNYKPK